MNVLQSDRYLIIKRNDTEDLNLYAYDLWANPPWESLNDSDFFECYPVTENGRDIAFDRKREAKKNMFIKVQDLENIMR